MNKKLILSVLIVLSVTLGAVALLWKVDRNQSRKSVKVSDAPHVAPAKPKMFESPTPARVPAYQSGAALADLPPTLSPNMFMGAARAAYTIAQEIPEALAQIPCYCHCDMNFGHQSLHSCFQDDHGASCGICMNEAMAAYKYQKEQKLTPAQIREKIIAEFDDNQHVHRD